MPKPTSSSKHGALKTLSYEQLHQIWGNITLEQVLSRFKAADASGNWTASSKALRGRCPFHTGAVESFYVYPSRGYAVCHDCGHMVTNFVALWAKITRSSTMDSLVELKDTFGLGHIQKGQIKSLEHWETLQTVKQRIMLFCHRALVEATINPSDEEYNYAQPCVHWLTQTRGIDVNALLEMPFLGVLPPFTKLMQQAQALEEIDLLNAETLAKVHKGNFVQPPSYLDAIRAYIGGSGGHGHTSWLGSAVIQLDYAVDVIGKLKFRRCNSTDAFLLDDLEEESGFMGLSWPQYQALRHGEPDANRGMYVVKSEFDALTVMSKMLQTDGRMSAHITSAGSSARVGPLDYLPRSGFPEAYLVPDAGERGDDLVRDWLGHARKTRCKVFTKTEIYEGAHDPDNFVQRNGLPPLWDLLKDAKNKANFSHPPDWVFDRSVPLVEAIDPGELRQRVAAVAEYGRVLKDPIECEVFIDACVKQWGFPINAIRREIVSKDEDEPGFVLRCAEALRKEFFIIGQEITDQARRLHMWHRQTEQYTWVNLSDDNHAERQLGPILGPAYQWFIDRVGIPQFLEVSDEQRMSGVYLQEMDKSLRWYTRQALMIVAHGSPNFGAALHCGQGLHMQRKRGDEAVFYLVNGSKVYFAVVTETGRCEWKELEGPAHEGIIFDTGTTKGAKPWLRSVNSVADIVRSEKMDPRDVYNRLRRMIDIGWRFHNHDLTVDYLAAHLLASTIACIYGRAVTTAFHADASSGKSRFAMGLIAGRDFPRIHVISAASGLANFTAAGVRQSWNNCTRPLVLDEFEDEGQNTRKSHEVEAIYEMIRPAVGADNTFNMGSRTGEKVEYHLNFFLFVAAINRPRKPQDASRQVALSMQHVQGRADPVHVILNDLGDDYVQKLRDDIEVLMYGRLTQMKLLHGELEKEFSQPGARPAGVDARYFEALLPAMGVMKLLGLDYKKFATEFCTAMTTHQGAVGTRTDSQSLMDWVFQSPEVIAQIDSTRPPLRTTINYLLGSPGTRSLINESNSGVYFDEVSALVVVNWTQAIQTVLSKHPKYRNESNITNLREMANRAEMAKSPEVIKQSGALDRLKRYGLHGVSANNLTAYSVIELLKQQEDQTAATTPQPQTLVEEEVSNNVDFS